MRPAMPGKHHLTMGGKHDPIIDTCTVTASRSLAKQSQFEAKDYFTPLRSVRNDDGTCHCETALWRSHNDFPSG